jgi:hypothetical protein
MRGGGPQYGKQNTFFLVKIILFLSLILFLSVTSSIAYLLNICWAVDPSKRPTASNLNLFISVALTTIPHSDLPAICDHAYYEKQNEKNNLDSQGIIILIY